MRRQKSGPPPIIFLIIFVIIAVVFLSKSQLNPFGKTSENSPDTSQSSQPNFKTFASVQNVPQGLFSYSGSTTWALIRKEIDPLLQTVWPEFKLRYVNPSKEALSSGAGISMLSDKQIEFAQSSRPITDQERELAQQRGLTLTEIPIAIDGIAVIVSPSLPIQGLTVAQFEDIKAGKIRNWQEVGGPNLKLQLYGKVNRDAEADYIILTQTTTEALRKVAADPGGIYWASASLLIGQCNVKPLALGNNSNVMVAPYKEPLIPMEKCPQERNQVNIEVFRSGEYPLSRKLFVIIQQNGKIEQQAGEAYANLLLTEQGQELIEKAGFVKIR